MKYLLKNKKVFLIFILMFFILILEGCGSKTEDKLAEAVDSNNSGYPFNVVDYLGREVTISKPVKNIACGYAYTGHAAALLGRGQDIVAVVGGLQRDKILTTMYPYIKDLPVPFTSGAINIEELLMCKPDIVFIRCETAFNESEVAKLDKFGLPYVVIDYKSMEEQMNSILLIGKVLGEQEKANEYLEYYKKVVSDTAEIAARIPQKEITTLYHSVNEATRTDIRESLPADWLNTVGVINVSVDQKLRDIDNANYATLEQIYLWDPDFIIANEAGVPDYIINNEQWKGLRAVRENRVYQIPNGISRWGHPGSIETPLAILWTSQLVYPDYFAHINMIDETKEYYSRFFNISLSDEEVNNILMGKGMRVPKNFSKEAK